MAVIRYRRTTAEETTREVTTMDDLLSVLMEAGYASAVTFDLAREGRWYRVKAELVGESTGVHFGPWPGASRRRR